MTWRNLSLSNASDLDQLAAIFAEGDNNNVHEMRYLISKFVLVAHSVTLYSKYSDIDIFGMVDHHCMNERQMETCRAMFVVVLSLTAKNNCLFKYPDSVSFAQMYPDIAHRFSPAQSDIRFDFLRDYANVLNIILCCCQDINPATKYEFMATVMGSCPHNYNSRYNIMDYAVVVAHFQIVIFDTEWFDYSFQGQNGASCCGEDIEDFGIIYSFIRYQHE